MKDEKPRVPDVNLLPGDDLAGRPGGIFLQWALTWGKRIVVTTELIVILAFLSRFWLDTEVANLSEAIDQKKLVVQSESDFEKQFRSLSQRVAKAKALESLPTPLSVYDKVQPLIPATVFVSQLSVDTQTVSLVASADEASLGKMAEAFKNSPEFSNVSVEGVSQLEASSGVGFTLHANIVYPPKP